MSIDLGYDPIQRLEEIQSILVDPPPGAMPVKVYELEDGRECQLWPLFEIPGQVSVGHAFMPEGGVFVSHKHDEMECLIPYSGRVIDLMLSNPRQVGPKQVLNILPGQPHRVMALEDTWMIAVTVPASEAYPHAD